MNDKRKLIWSALLLILLICPIGGFTAEETYTVPTKVQDLATTNKVYEKLGSPKDQLYNDTLTAIDLIAKTRAELMHRNIIDEDYVAAGWILCVMPWTPPKDPPDIEKMKKLRPELVGGVFTTEDKRLKFVDHLDRSRLALSAKEIKAEHLKPWNFFKDLK
jgi:hypothetical protein